MPYAENTEVDPTKSRVDIERVLRRYGADQFITGYDDTMAFVQFRAPTMPGRNDDTPRRYVRFQLPLPPVSDYATTPTGKRRTATSQQSAWEQSVRQRWRALHLVIKAKLESVESEIESFEAAFMPHIVLPDGSTVGDHMLGQIAAAYDPARTGDWKPKALPW